MPRLIDSFLRTLPVHQSKQVLTLLNQLSNTGTVRTTEEYRTLLTQLTESLRSTDISQPAMVVDPATPGQLVSAYEQQKMLRYGQSDIGSAFSALNSISLLLESQEHVMRIDYLTKLKAALDALEASIIRFEWQHLNRYEGLNNGRYYRFDSDLVYNPRTTLSGVPFLFRDRRAYMDLGPEFDCIPSRFDEKITLPTETLTEITPVLVRKLDTSSGSTSDVDVSFPGNDISNLLGSSTGRYWIHEVLWDTPTNEGAILYLEFLFDVYSPINTLAIEPADSTGLWLDQVDLYTYGDLVETVLDEPRFLRGNVKLSFDATTARRAVLKFRQSAYSKKEYRYNPETGIYEHIVSPLRTSPFDLLEATSDAAAVITSRTARDLAGIELTYDPSVIYKYDYLFAFDNVRFFSASYKDVGIFVTDKIESTGTFAVACSTEQEIVDQSTAEVWCMKLNYDGEGNLIDTETFEVPEIATSTSKLVSGERLIIPSGNVGSTRFYPDWALVAPTVYRNGEALASTEYATSIDNITFTAGSTPVGTAISPHTYWIRINDYDSASAYTVDYVMQLSPSDLSTKYYLNSDQTVFVSPDGFAGFINERVRSRVVSSELYGVLILRQNNPSNLGISGGVKSFRFLVGDNSVVTE